MFSGIFLYQNDFDPYLKNGEEKGDFWKKSQICEYILAEPSHTLSSEGAATCCCLNFLSVGNRVQTVSRIYEYLPAEHNSQTMFI